MPKFIFKADLTEPNFYTITTDKKWIMRIQVNGELTEIEQSVLVAGITALMNKTHNEAAKRIRDYPGLDPE